EGSFPLFEAGHGAISTGGAFMGCSSAAHSPDALPDGAVAINHPAQPRSGKKLVGRRSPRDRGGDLPVHLAHLASAPAPMHLAGALGLYAGPVHRASGPRPHPAPIWPTSGPYLAHVWPTSGPVFRLFPDRHSGTVRASLQARARPSSCAAACEIALQNQGEPLSVGHPAETNAGTRMRRMNKRRRVYEGKAKVLYEGPEPGTLIQHFKDDATAFNNKKHALIEGKGVLNNRISEHIFAKLGEIGVPTHFVRRLNMREQLIREVEIIPLEVVVRNVAAGSLAQRLGLEEGKALPRSIIE